jgi:MFS family permease
VGPSQARSEGAERRGRSTSCTYASALGDRRFRRLLLGHTVLVLFGYSQLGSTLPVLFNTRLGITAPVIGGLVMMNTAAVVCLQPFVTRSTRRLARETLLRSVGVVWAAADTLVLVSAACDPRVRVPLLVLFAVLFALGECLYAPSFQPMVTDLSPAEGTGRYGGLTAMSWEVGMMAGPAAGIMLVAAGGILPYWSVFGGGVVLASVLVAPFGRRPAWRTRCSAARQGEPT